MSLKDQLSSLDHNFQQNAPGNVKEPILTARANFQTSYQPTLAIHVGDTIPEFRLSDAVGNEVTSASLLSQGPLLITLYRGGWCPFCNLALAAMQKNVDEFKAKGVTLVAISPELPNQSLSTTEKNALKFTVLSDVGNKFAKQLGILFPQPDIMRPVFEKFGHDLKTCNGDDSLEVPVPALCWWIRKALCGMHSSIPIYEKVGTVDSIAVDRCIAGLGMY